MVVMVMAVEDGSSGGPRAAFTPLVFVASGSAHLADLRARLVDGAGGGRTGPSCYLHRLTRAATMSRDGRPDLGQATVDLSLILPADRAYSETAAVAAPDWRPTARPPARPPQRARRRLLRRRARQLEASPA